MHYGSPSMRHDRNTFEPSVASQVDNGNASKQRATPTKAAVLVEMSSGSKL
jgi:hypothetical protein